LLYLPPSLPHLRAPDPTGRRVEHFFGATPPPRQGSVWRVPS
jgi:hypothetical protein